MPDPVSIVTVVTTLMSVLGSSASMVAAFLEVIKVSKEVDKIISVQERQEIINAKAQFKDISNDEAKRVADDLVISPVILISAVQGIKKAEQRYEKTIIDVRYTPAQLEQETKIVQAEICSFLQLIKDHNAGSLPHDLDRYWLSYRCDQSPV